MLHKPTGKLYLTDFNLAHDFSLEKDLIKEDFVINDKYQTRLLESGNFYAPGAEIPEYKDPWSLRGYDYWYMSLFKFAFFDRNKDGVISDDEEKVLEASYGDEASTIQYLYNSRMNDLGLQTRTELLTQANGKTILDMEHVHSGSHVSNLVATLKEHWHYPVSKGSQRVIDKKGPEDAAGKLVADEVLILTGGDVTDKRLFPLFAQILNEKFAKNRGYRFTYFDGNLSAIDKQNGGRDRVPYWIKIYMILDLLEQPKNRVLVWLDDDGIVSDNGNENMIERYLREYPSRDLIIALDRNQFAVLNSGSMIIRNTPGVRKLFKEVLQVGEEQRCCFDDKNEKQFRTLMSCKQSYACVHEQQALQELYDGTRRDCDEKSTVMEKTSVLPRKNSEKWRQLVAEVLSI